MKIPKFLSFPNGHLLFDHTQHFKREKGTVCSTSILNNAREIRMAQLDPMFCVEMSSYLKQEFLMGFIFQINTLYRNVQVSTIGRQRMCIL